MPNWCSTAYVIEGNVKEVKSLYELMKGLQERAGYEAVLSSSDEVIILSEHYFQGCFLRRNDYMVCHCSRLISWYDGKPKGGTFYTCRKATAGGLQVSNLDSHSSG